MICHELDLKENIITLDKEVDNTSSILENIDDF